MSLLILVLSLLLIIQILEIIVVQDKKYIALKVSENDFVMSVNGRDVMTNFVRKELIKSYTVLIIKKLWGDLYLKSSFIFLENVF